MVSDAHRQLCQGRRKDGQPCRALASTEGYCVGHAPHLDGMRQAARRKGGRNKSTAARLGKLVPPRLIPIFDKLESALEEVHTGALDPRRASAMAALAGALVRVLTAGEVEERVRRLEEGHYEQKA